MKKQSVKRQRIIAIISFSLVIILGLIASNIVPVVAKYYAHQTRDYTMAYQTYAPTWLPGNLRLTPKELTITDYTDEVNKSITFASSDKNFNFYEEEDSGSETVGCGGKQAQGSCERITTPSGYVYKFETHYLDGNDNVTPDTSQTIQYLRGATYFYISLDKDLVNKYSKDDWSHVIDSLQPLDVTKLPINIKPYVYSGP